MNDNNIICTYNGVEIYDNDISILCSEYENQYTDIEELTVPMINEYIEKVVVHEATGERKGKYRKQQVDVYFNFIGNCQVPQKVDIEKMA